MLSRITRLVMTCAYRARRLGWRLTGRRPFGVHGVALTAGGEVVLVRLTYAPGWQLPGGGRKRGESSKDSMLRELREEIGLRAWSAVEELGGRRPRASPSDRGAIFVVRGAVFQPRRSFEIAEVRAFAPDALPDDLTPWTRAALAIALPMSGTKADVLDIAVDFAAHESDSMRMESRPG